MSEKWFDACVAFVLESRSNKGASSFVTAKRRKEKTYSKSYTEAYVLSFLDVFFKSNFAIISVYIVVLMEY